jgi:hypothetical protein
MKSEFFFINIANDKCSIVSISLIYKKVEVHDSHLLYLLKYPKLITHFFINNHFKDVI